MHQLFKTKYGSRLYGTNTATSDYDYKVLYLPTLEDLLLNRHQRPFKIKLDSVGNKLSEHEKMPADGIETEYIPLYDFVSSYFSGQAYAVELVAAHRSNVYDYIDERFVPVIEKLQTYKVNTRPMCEYGDAQSAKYIKKANNLSLFLEIDEYLKTIDIRAKIGIVAEQLVTQFPALLRIDHDTLWLFSTQFSYKVPVSELQNSVRSTIKRYGHRVVDAINTDTVDWKSLGHAYRLYTQAELYNNDTLIYPLPEEVISTILKIRAGGMPFSEIEDLITNLRATTGRYDYGYVIEDMKQVVLSDFLKSFYSL